MAAEPVIAVISAGEMGSQVGRLLREHGARVLTWLEGRSPATARRAAEAGLEAADLETLVRQSRLIVSLVPSSAAEPLAVAVAQAIRLVGQAPLYLDANSIGPQTTQRLARHIETAGGTFVDGAVIGGAADLRGRTRCYLSGEQATAVAALLDPPLLTTVLGHEAGQASAFKVLYAGLTKGLSALGLELLAGAQQLGLRQQLIDKFRDDHPSVATFLERQLPGLPPRAARRALEMVELADTLAQLGLTANTARAARATLQAVADAYGRAGPPPDETLAALAAWWVERDDRAATVRARGTGRQ